MTYSAVIWGRQVEEGCGKGVIHMNVWVILEGSVCRSGHRST